MEEDTVEELLVEHARYGELEDLVRIATSEGLDLLATARDASGNSCMHCAAANGHLDIIVYLLEHVQPADFAPLNKAGSNPVHWACLNAQLEVLRMMCPSLPDEPLLQKDRGGMTPLEVAEAKGSDAALECAGFLLGMLSMREKQHKTVATDANDTGDLEHDLQKATLAERPPPIDPGPER